MPKQKQKARPRVAVMFECPCGMRHQVQLGLGELQVLERNIITGKNKPLAISVKTFAPTGKVLGNGEPEYIEFKRPQK